MTIVTRNGRSYLFLFGFGVFCLFKQCKQFLLTYYSEDYYLLLLPNYLLIITRILQFAITYLADIE